MVRYLVIRAYENYYAPALRWHHAGQTSNRVARTFERDRSNRIFIHHAPGLFSHNKSGVIIGMLVVTTLENSVARR